MHSETSPLLPIKEFTLALKPGASIFYTHASPEIKAAWTQLGLQLSTTERDLRFLSLAKESLDGFWWDNADHLFTLEESQRVLISAFQSLKPASGIFGITYSIKAWGDRAPLVLLRQSGFKVFRDFSRDSERCLICTRP